MKKFAVFSGFLGSGKTTTMMALTQYDTAHWGKAAMISNDLGRQSLADNRLAKLAGCNASELTGACICYQTENLAARLDQLFESDGCDLVISDIPGFGVGALEHVYHTLQEQYPGKYALAPFTVLTEPRTVELLRNARGGDLAYILTTQLMEADLIVLNKCDLLSEEDRQRDLAWLREHYPQARILGISALTGQGLEELALALSRGAASMHRPDIGYGSMAFGEAMSRMSEYYIQYYAAVCCNDFDANAYLLDLAKKVRHEMLAAGGEIPHLKLLAWEPEGDYAKADLLGVDRPVEISKKISGKSTGLAVMLNASALCPGPVLDRIITGAAETVSEDYDLTMMIFQKECFGMGEQQ